jgi:hypothetical protein
MLTLDNGAIYRRASDDPQAKNNGGFEMMIFKLIQKSMGDGAMTDFCLPRTMGYFATQGLADARQARIIASETNNAKPLDERLTDFDFTIKMRIVEDGQ